MPEQSLSVNVFLYICLPERSATTVLPNRSHPPTKARPLLLCFICSLEVQVVYYRLFENYYNQWLLLVLLVRFSAGLSGSDDFVLFDSLDGNSAYWQMFYVIFQFYAYVKFATTEDLNNGAENSSLYRILLKYIKTFILNKYFTILMHSTVLALVNIN